MLWFVDGSGGDTHSLRRLPMKDQRQHGQNEGVDHKQSMLLAKR